jgi:hypothetical protein
VVTKKTAIDNAYIKKRRAALGGKGGAKPKATDCSRGGSTTKIHALTDVAGHPYALMLIDRPVSPMSSRTWPATGLPAAGNGLTRWNWMPPAHPPNAHAA